MGVNARGFVARANRFAGLEADAVIALDGAVVAATLVENVVRDAAGKGGAYRAAIAVFAVLEVLTPKTVRGASNLHVFFSFSVSFKRLPLRFMEIS